MDSNITIQLGKHSSACKVLVDDIDISKHVRRVVIDAQAGSITRAWIEIFIIKESVKLEGIEDIQFYKGIPEDFPFKEKEIPKDVQIIPGI